MVARLPTQGRQESLYRTAPFFIEQLDELSIEIIARIRHRGAQGRNRLSRNAAAPTRDFTRFRHWVRRGPPTTRWRLELLRQVQPRHLIQFVKCPPGACGQANSHASKASGPFSFAENRTSLLCVDTR